MKNRDIDYQVMTNSLYGEPEAKKQRYPERCNRCIAIMTWAAQKRQYGRLIRYGLTNDEAKVMLPMCQKCVTQYLNHNKK